MINSPGSYRGKDGTKKFHGTKRLKETQQDPYIAAYVFPSLICLYPFLMHILLRCYTPGFCQRLLECYNSRGVPPADVRHKRPLDLSKSDKQLWEEMPTADVVLDGRLHQVWGYLLGNRHLCVPASWQSSIAAFDKELHALEACPHTPWAPYVSPRLKSAVCIYVLEFLRFAGMPKGKGMS